MRFIEPSIKQKTDLEDASYWYYSKWPIIRKIYFSRLKNGLKFIPDKKQRILDIGLGCGILLPSLARNGSDVYGIDSNKNFLKKAEDFCSRMNIKANLCVANASNLPYKDNFFDCAISLSVLEHVSNLDAALKEASRVLKPKGILVVGVPIDRFIVNSFFKFFGVLEHVRGYHVNDYVEVRNLLKNHFDITQSNKMPANIFPDFLSIYLVMACVNKK